MEPRDQSEAIGQINYMRMLVAPPKFGLGGMRLGLMLIGGSWFALETSQYLVESQGWGWAKWIGNSLGILLIGALVYAVMRDLRRSRRSRAKTSYVELARIPFARTFMVEALLIVVLAILIAVAGGNSPRFRPVYVPFWMGALYASLGAAVWSKEHLISGSYIMATAVLSTFLSHPERHLFFGLTGGAGLILLMLYFGRPRRTQPESG